MASIRYSKNKLHKDTVVIKPQQYRNVPHVEYSFPLIKFPEEIKCNF